jgi:hypothetical protein
MNLVFWDLQVIVKLARCAPHVIENTHECNCRKCRYNWDLEWYECSECWEEESTLSKFWRKWAYRCTNKKCWVELLSPEEYRWNLQNKMEIYNPMNK